MKGIGRAKDGSGNMSIVLSGGYVDDKDFGDEIIYTGEGGRDENSGQQIEDQAITGGNRDLIAAFEAGEPVYVTRGSKHKSPYSPSSGYEFAGIFYITEHWIEKGQDGFDIIRFKLANEKSYISPGESDVNVETTRVSVTSTRIIRETKIAKEIKELYGYACQVCGDVIDLPTGSKYAEAAHIKPLGRPHNGPDTISNLLCLCPNHHLMFDKYCYSIDPDNFELAGLSGSLRVTNEHYINKDCITYHYVNYLSHKGNPK